jgi:hypothetical protein
MKHSVELANRLLAKHHTAVQDGPVWRYPPKTPDAAKYWVHTGVCPSCYLRSLSVGRCAECGWRKG